MTFDPLEYMKGIQQLLISDKKRIAFLCGAGTSLAKKNKFTKNAPAVTAMTENVVRELKKNPVYEKAIEHGLKGNTYDNVEKAYSQAIADSSDDDFIFVGGSSYIVADFLTLLSR